MSRSRHDRRAAREQHEPTTDAGASAGGRISLADCKPRTIYELYSRNLVVGVFTGEPDGGFVGVRHKAGATYLFTEYHVEAPAFNTVRPLRELGSVPDGIEVREWLGSVCETCGSRRISYVEYFEPLGWTETRADGTEYERRIRGGWVCFGCTDPRPCAVGNPELLELLLPLDAAILAAEADRGAGA